MPISIRRVGPDDLTALRALAVQTFTETFAEHNTPENMAQYCTVNLSPHRLQQELENPLSAFYFACNGEELAGYLKLNVGAAQTELRDEASVEIERIYVLKAFHGQQVGQHLFEQALEVARSRAADYIWLGVWEKNTRAIRFYEKNGFRIHSQHVFRLGDDAQTDYIMRKELAP